MAQDSTSPIYARRALDDGLVVLRDNRSTPRDRRDAAWVLLQLRACDIVFDERICTDLLRIIAQRIAESAVAVHLMQLLRKRAPDADAIARAVVRLCELASGKHPASLDPIVAVALQVPSWRAALLPAWVAQVATHRLEGGHLCGAVEILVQSVRPPPAHAEWARLILDQHPLLLGADGLSSSERWYLHALAPSTVGWRLLASHVGERNNKVRCHHFAETLDDAIGSLEEAISLQAKGAARFAMTRWRAALNEGRE